jgi:hypothetical protein
MAERRATLALHADVVNIDRPIYAEGRKSNRMQPIFAMTNDRFQGGFETASWAVAYYFFGS